jgi:hypothetical protein
VLWEDESRRVVAEAAISYHNWEDEDLWNASVLTARNHRTALCVWAAQGPLTERTLVIRRSGEHLCRNVSAGERGKGLWEASLLTCGCVIWVVVL